MELYLLIFYKLLNINCIIEAQRIIRFKAIFKQKLYILYLSNILYFHFLYIL